MGISLVLEENEPLERGKAFCKHVHLRMGKEEMMGSNSCWDTYQELHKIYVHMTYRSTSLCDSNIKKTCIF